MRKIFALSILCIAAVSCVIINNDEPERIRENRLKSLTGELFRCSVENIIDGMEACVKIDDFIKADDEGKKDGRFSEVAFYASNGKYIADNYSTVYPGSESLFEIGSVWKYEIYGISIKAECIGDREWKLSLTDIDSYDYYYDFDVCPENITFEAHAKLTGRDNLYKGMWEYDVNGEYVEDAAHSARFSATQMKFFWSTHTYSDVIRISRECKGTFEAIFNVNGKDMDKCTLVSRGDSEDFHYQEMSVTRL